MTLRHATLFLADVSGGGAERMMVQLADGMSQAGIRVDLVLARAVGPYLDAIPDHVRVVDLRRRGVIHALPALVRYLREERPQALVTTLHHTSLIALAARARAGVETKVFVREANTPSGQVIALHDVRAHVIAGLMRVGYRRSDGVLAVSRGVADDLRRTRGVPERKLTIVHNPVVTPEMASMAAAEVPHAWLRDGAAPVVLGVGRLHPQKDFETLLEAFAILRGRRAAKLIILGEGEQRQRLTSLAAELGIAEHIDLPGFVENPFAFMARSSVFALSSIREGLPGALVQALACGCPAVATDCPSGPSEVLGGGRFGELVPMRDPPALADAIDRVLEHPPDRRTLREAVAPYESERAVRAHVRAIEAVLALDDAGV